jgi:16S rRNA (adenine1518-N6/adenine1519-N6)-dimethyltransferase
VTVLEIGPGPGGLTRALLALGADPCDRGRARRARESRPCREIAEHYPGRLDIVAADALTFDPRPRLDRTPVRIVANLPYNIATALLVSWLSVEPWPPWYDAAVLMFQREVAERIVANTRFKILRPPVGAGHSGAARRAFFSTSTPLGFRAAAEGHVLARASCPAAGSNRWRAIARLLENVTQAAFGQRRKMLRQSLRSLGMPMHCGAARGRGLSPTARAEDISVAGFVVAGAGARRARHGLGHDA